MRLSIATAWLSLGAALDTAQAITMDYTSADSIKSAAAQVAYGTMKYYTGNNTGDVPGNLPSPYYWWEAGAMFMTIIDYWYYTGDDTYNSETVQAIDWQAGTTGSFMPSNQTADEGNDDQVFWAFAAMTAAEFNFESPASGYPSWVAMAQAVFNEQAGRWDSQTCNGGLRWQIFPTNNGYEYRNAISNGGFFMLASRLARYTGNDTYTAWAEKAWDWVYSGGGSVLLDNSTYQINDGTSDLANCTDADHTQWSYNYGVYLGGLAYLYNHTSNATWLPHIQGVLNKTLATFFPENMGPHIFVEVTCEPYGTCTTDDWTFKGFTSRWLAVTAQLVPSVADQIWPYLQASGKGAAGQCDGGTDGITCGFEWNTTTWDGTYGVGQQMSALSAIGATMLALKDNGLGAPYTTDTGGTSVSDPNAGTDSSSDSGESAIYTKTITTGDRAGAGILTALALILTLGGAAWLVTGA
ncbi:glycoside hydrolase family 76 protein [Teratosphaeria destructans]|uniref:Mannan endo-1,6-alpha-mannosidase n=1 Tax=Teratosphaeria destructans TaxID=418781 RepID=A0A9W7T1U6_9PEZI|nr:glycoside hydrolase family 76 protein [Teratosphaeria destructans]